MTRTSRLRALSAVGAGRRLGALGVLIASTAVVVGSGADFTSASANPANTFTAGSLTHTNSKSASAILTATNMRPGDPATVGTVDIKNTGSLAGTFQLTKSNVSSTPASPAFATKLTVVVADCGLFSGATPPSCTGATPVYSGTISAMGATSLGSYAAAAQHRYQFSVTFPDGGTGGADNAYQGATASVEYDWDAVS